MTERIGILGCGYTNTFLSRFYMNRGHQVIATTTSDARIPLIKDHCTEIIKSDTSDAACMDHLMANSDTLIIGIKTKEYSKEGYERAYIQATRDISNALHRDTSQVSKVIYFGCVSVYGDYKGEWVTEESPLNITDEFERALAIGEQTILDSTLAAQHTVALLRLGAIYGPYRPILRLFRPHIEAGVIKGSRGDNIFNWTNVVDAIGAAEHARKKHLSGTYNVVDNTKFETRHIIEDLCNRNNLPIPTWEQESEYYAKVRSLCVSNRKIKDTGYSFRHPYIFED